MRSVWGFRVWGLGFRVRGFGRRIWDGGLDLTSRLRVLDCFHASM